MVGYNTTNLGDQAQTIRLVAEEVTALNYQQPFQQLGTRLLPIAAATITNIPYVAGFNKYILYVDAPATTVAINETLRITGVPVSTLGLATVNGSVIWALNGATPAASVFPVYTQSMSALDIISGLETISLQVLSSTAATYSSGTAYFKIVITFNLD